MSTKSFALIAASVVGMLGFAQDASAQVMYGYGYNSGPVTSYPAVPAMYSANYRAPGPSGNVGVYNQYTAGMYGVNPYSGGVRYPSSMHNSMHNSGLSYGNYNGFNSYGYNTFGGYNNYGGLYYNGRGAAFGGFRRRW